MMMYLLCYMVFMNLLTLFLYGIDKKRAIQRKWRIPEKTLLGTALAGGSIGALAGMQVFHHKTKHWTFRICVPVFLLLHLGLLYVWFMKIL